MHSSSGTANTSWQPCFPCGLELLPVKSTEPPRSLSCDSVYLIWTPSVQTVFRAGQNLVGGVREWAVHSVWKHEFYVYTTFQSHLAPANHLSQITNIPGHSLAQEVLTTASACWSPCVATQPGALLKAGWRMSDTELVYLNRQQDPPSLFMLC